MSKCQKCGQEDVEFAGKNPLRHTVRCGNCGHIWLEIDGQQYEMFPWEFGVKLYSINYYRKGYGMGVAFCLATSKQEAFEKFKAADVTIWNPCYERKIKLNDVYEEDEEVVTVHYEE